MSPSSPLESALLFELGPMRVSTAVAVTWLLMLVLATGSWLLTRRLSLRPTAMQSLLELLVETLDGQIRDTMQSSPERYRALIGSLFIFILAANWSSLIPGVEPPTAVLETDTALALVVLAASIGYGIAVKGLGGYLRTFAEPSWVMIPLNIVEQLTRTFSLIVRLFGNIMSGVFVIGIALSLAGLLVPIPFMALDLLTGAIQAYIFSVLAMVFIGAAVAR
ncbi:MAG: ATP synthase F0 subunit A [Pseudomonas sp.]|jgi:F-type H+-transporting ATPase subunit a|uniref:F0F1 ATP synthase subunit A n=1 Tax=Stutzerimonas xanthomarina TaxID=271420 RepID=UPI000C4F8BEB|nr:F0F1 ATP synthase subunit A [Stutzerimonas xanthomarina]MAX90589.1 ATP synthase F0 subunit A [Pseudomonas sp.]MBU0811734.1 F0F1 ATP synthase subunit A [Gammaproteobacteria bacterium]MBK3846870.1 F0F1 ATP synthase subunit A [Stutzerimonas xanthomarina]MBK59792.1 ATP synthase F0 subunit A [Pseudomonas sp.]MBU0853921.1 F0F1 ATP synthase subunit A [Gammaproteobacteria bacterium]|tara:strand:- start:1354 stop:2016 length:663 start_codon:yes stop_codon:yes gene_type:complete